MVLYRDCSLSRRSLVLTRHHHSLACGQRIQIMVPIWQPDRGTKDKDSALRGDRVTDLQFVNTLVHAGRTRSQEEEARQRGWS